MKRLVFAAVALLLFPAVSSGQGMMRLYRAMYSVSGSYSSGRTDTDLKFPAATAGTEFSYESIQLATRSGAFVTRSLLIGVEFDWYSRRGEIKPSPNPSNQRARQFDRELFLGPLLRWYQPMTVRWFVYPEVAVGYQHALGEFEESNVMSSTLPATTTASGVGVFAGAGLGYFLTRNLVLDATLRYSHRWLEGSHEVAGQPDIDAEISGGDVSVLVGFQLLM